MTGAKLKREASILSSCSLGELFLQPLTASLIAALLIKEAFASIGDDRRQRPLIILMIRNTLDYADVMITVITLMIPTRDILFVRLLRASQTYLFKKSS
jgi:hypothetical protein